MLPYTHLTHPLATSPVAACSTATSTTRPNRSSKTPRAAASASCSSTQPRRTRTRLHTRDSPASAVLHRPVRSLTHFKAVSTCTALFHSHSTALSRKYDGTSFAFPFGVKGDVYAVPVGCSTSSDHCVIVVLYPRLSSLYLVRYLSGHRLLCTTPCVVQACDSVVIIKF